MVTQMLELERVTKYFGSKLAVRDATLLVRAGERVVVMGDNGSGKSTLLAIASGVLDADSGRVGRPKTIGYAPEKPDIPDHLLVAEWLDVVASLKRARRADDDDLGIRSLLGKRVSALSLGQRQRVSLSACFLGKPEMLVLDEPTNALDRDARAAVIARLRIGTALVATHDRELVGSLDARVVQMNDGRLAPPQERTLAVP
jgi:ABC-type multidrug transport system ATPase subunit